MWEDRPVLLKRDELETPRRFVTDQITGVLEQLRLQAAEAYLPRCRVVVPFAGGAGGGSNEQQLGGPWGHEGGRASLLTTMPGSLVITKLPALWSNAIRKHAEARRSRHKCHIRKWNIRSKKRHFNMWNAKINPLSPNPCSCFWVLSRSSSRLGPFGPGRAGDARLEEKLTKICQE